MKRFAVVALAFLIFAGIASAQTAPGTQNPVDFGESSWPQPAHPAYTVTFVTMTSHGVVIPMAPFWAMKWVRKNAQNYPTTQFGGPPVLEAQNFVIAFFTDAGAVSSFRPRLAYDEQGLRWVYPDINGDPAVAQNAPADVTPQSVENFVVYAMTYDTQASPVPADWQSLVAQEGLNINQVLPRSPGFMDTPGDGGGRPGGGGGDFNHSSKFPFMPQLLEPCIGKAVNKKKGKS